MLAGPFSNVVRMKVREEEDMRTYVERKDAGKARRGVATVIESERAPGTNSRGESIDPWTLSPLGFHLLSSNSGALAGN